MILLSTAEERARKLADEVVRPAAPVALFVAAHERVHGETAQRAVASLSIATNTSRPVSDVAGSV